ncbi:formylglycine-generating enzyme family protein [Microcoleus vaginatus PCC 9802]|uniref:formylglycine-generating enzyme family protein n=1 Tax=Microcoleus vaginatus TaxID=119532 RepID=UPI00020D2EED|nr:Sulphatase-modifying factor protein [Microcoleus vaginatus FGP-2]UNU19754.1 formylglycine-generating enzyme family protein [Microcoleus vaginatus PCC 9802]
MPSDRDRPREYDAVKGGQNSIPVGAAVQGGIAGVKTRLPLPSVEARIAALSEALKYGDAGLDLILGALQDESVQVKLAVYSLLKDRNEEKIKQHLQNYFFDFDVITVNSNGRESSRSKSFAFYFPEDLGNGIVLEMVYIPGGTLMVDWPVTEVDRYRDYGEGGKPQVTIPAFYASKYPITQAQWEAVMGKTTNQSSFTGEKRPVENVSWLQAIRFCRRLSQKTSKKYRLLSKAEWEYACRAGTTAPFDSDFFMQIIKEVNREGNHLDLDAPQGLHRQIKDVGSFPPNAFGLYDMHGKVAEWCGNSGLNDTDEGPESTGGIISLLTRMGLDSIGHTDPKWFNRTLHLCHSPYQEGIGSSLIEGVRVAMSSYSSPS